MDDGVDGQQNVCGVVDDGGGVTGTNAQSGLAGGVSGLDHAGATGGQDDVGLLHDGVGHLQGGNVDPVDDAGGSACGNGGVQNQLRGGDGGVLGTGVRADDDGITRLQSQEALENGRGGGVGGGDNGGNDADGLGDLLNAVSLVLLDHAAGLGVLVCVVDVLGGVVVLDDLILDNTHTGLGDGLLGQADASLVGGRGGGQEDLVDLLLGVGGEELLGGSDTLDGVKQGIHAGHGDAVHDCVGVGFHFLCPPKKMIYKVGC